MPSAGNSLKTNLASAMSRHRHVTGVAFWRPNLSRRKSMFRTVMVAAASAAALTLSPTAFAQQGQLGTAQEARAMLDKAVAAVKADQAVALEMFNKGDGGFRDRDLYPFCFRISDGKTLATPAAVTSGTDVRTLK